MYPMSLTLKKLAITISVGVIVVVGILFFWFHEYEVNGPSGWPTNIKLYRGTLTGDTRVVDSETGRTLFMYRPEYDFNVHPVRIEKTDVNHWQVVFEVPTK